MITEKEGQKLINLAWNSIDAFLTRKYLLIDEEINSSEVNGVVIELKKDSKTIGKCAIIESELPITRLIVEASRKIVLKNRINNLDDIKIKISLLSAPELITTNPLNYENRLILGEDSVLIKSKTNTGFMLRSETGNMNFEEFINNACIKTGLNKEAWLNPNNKVFKFKEQKFQN